MKPNSPVEAGLQPSSSIGSTTTASQNQQLANQSTNTASTEPAKSTFTFVDEGLSSANDFLRLEDQDNTVGYYDLLTKKL